MTQIVLGVWLAVGAVLLVLGLSLTLFTTATALIATGLLVIATAAVVRWYSGITPEVPAAAAEGS